MKPALRSTMGVIALMAWVAAASAPQPPTRIRTFTPELANDKYGINHVPGHDFHAGACTGVGATGASTK